MVKDPSLGASAFPSPHRRRHLQSETYKTLVRILSLCADHDSVPRSVRSADGSGNAESGEEKNVEGRTHNLADSATPDVEHPEWSNVPEDSLANQQLEGVIYDENRGSSNEQSTVNEIGHMLSIDRRDNCSTRQGDKMVGENCAAVRENIDESLVSIQGHNISTETAVIKEDPTINCDGAPLEKLTDRSHFQQTITDKSISLNRYGISVPLHENTNDAEVLEKGHVEDAFKVTVENEHIIQGKKSKAETQLLEGEPELSVKENFALENDHDESFDLHRVAGNDSAGLGGQLAGVDKLKPDVAEPFDKTEEFELEDSVTDYLRMIFDDDQALVRADDGMTEATSVGVKNSACVYAFNPVKQSDFQDLMSDEQAHVVKGQEVPDKYSKKVSEGLYSACGGHASATANASVSIDDSVEVQQSLQTDVNNFQEAAENYSKNTNLHSLHSGHAFVSQSAKDKSLMFGTGSPRGSSEIQLDIVQDFSDGSLRFPTVKTEKEEVEEGEISDGVEGNRLSCHESTVTNKIGTVQLSECVPSMKHHNSHDQPESDGPDIGSFSSMSNDMSKRMEDATRSDMERTVFETQTVLHGKPVAKEDMRCPAVKAAEVNSVGLIKGGGHSEAGLAHGISIRDTGTIASEKGNDIDKKRRRSCQSEERKEKRKIKKRKKRAEKNRELGVKRLKLPPMLPPKPKAVSVCRHFLKGRCQEVGNCKFSHDAVPLTKSKPCCHFARNACMKGDDCPYDHELSKYPCNNFASTGSCIRGNNCFFSHKVMPTDSLELAEDDPVKSKSASKLLATPSDLGLSKLAGCQGSTPGNALILHAPGSSDIAKQNLSSLGKSQTTEVKRNAKSVGRTSSASSANPSDPSRKVNNGRDSSCTSINVIGDNQIGTTRTPLVAPKGINFLSFGISPMDKPNQKKPISSGLALKLSALSSSLNAQRTEDSSQCINAGPSDLIPKDSVPERMESVNEDIKVTPQPEVKSLGKALSTDTPIAGDGISNFAARNMASSSMICDKVPISTIASAQSSDFSTPSPVKGTSASTLLAMHLGDAAVKLFGGNHSIFPGVDGETNRGISPNDSEKSLRILDFLASIGKKR